MSRLASMTLAALPSLAAIAVPTALQATSNDGHYFSAQLVEPTDEPTAIAGGVVFRCDGESCTGPRTGTRPLRVCTDLRREVGQIASFSVGGEPVAASLLERCNG